MKMEESFWKFVKTNYAGQYKKLGRVQLQQLTRHHACYQHNICLYVTEASLDALNSGKLKITIDRHGGQEVIGNIHVFVGAVSGDIYLSFVTDDGFVAIGSEVKGKFKAMLWADSYLQIGSRTTSNGTTIYAEKSDIRIGQDCMFSDEVVIQGTDQHGIVDLTTGKLINTQPKCLNIGEHVWLGRRSSVMPNATIGNGCILAFGAIATKIYLDVVHFGAFDASID